MKKKLIYIFLILLGLVSLPFIFVGLRVLFDLTNPLRRPVEQIREDILAITPLGISMEEAIDILETARVENNWGRLRNEVIGVSSLSLGLRMRPTVFGNRHIRIGLGGYTNFFRTSVSVFWAFDDEHGLIEVFVLKTIFGW